MKRLFLIVALALCSTAKAQSTFTAATCSQADVTAAIAAEQVGHVDGDTIAIPAGTCTWTGTGTITQTFSNSVTIQGAGAVYYAGHASGTSTTGSDQTIIIDHMTGNNPPMDFTTTAGKSFRVTGIFFKTDGTSVSHDHEQFGIVGTSTSVRIDHCHFNPNTTSSGGVFFGGAVTGVGDHNFLDNASGVETNFVLHEENWLGEATNYGDGSWADKDYYGSSKFVFVEDNLFHNGGLGDGSWGGRYVMRYNVCYADTAPSVGDCQMYDHGLTPGRQRGNRIAEVYLNTFTQPGVTGTNHPTHSYNSGAVLYWGNTVTQYRYALGIDYSRQAFTNPPNYTYNPPPVGWGWCDGGGTNFTAWDDNATTGYPCMDAIGRGGGDLLDGNFPVVCNKTTFPGGCSTFLGSPLHQVLSPLYVWNNTFTPAGGYGSPFLVSTGATQIQDNRDYYQQFGTYAEPGSFNGTAGVGQGSSLPSAAQPTCTPSANALPGGTTWLGVSVSGFWGPGYWDTANSTLYVCTATNTWTAYYTPYAYPHPLIGGGQVATPVFSPTAGTYSGAQAITISTTTGGARLCYTTDGSTPTADGAGTCTHGSTYSTPVVISSSLTLKSMGSLSGVTDSAVGSAAYTINTGRTAPAVAILAKKGH